MPYSQPVRTTAAPSRSTILAALVTALIAVVVLACVLGWRSATGLSSAAPPPAVKSPTEAHNGAEPAAHRREGRPRGSVPELPGPRSSGVLDAADGAVPDGTTVFDDIPAVAELDPALLAALREAATDAATYGVVLGVNSGWRSEEYQRQLFEEAVARYGSEADAERWVARPGTSVHETGDAVDIGPSSATTWLAGHGAAYGLCQVYGNEPWHYELRSDAVVGGCPTTYSDPTDDPRVQQ